MKKLKLTEGSLTPFWMKDLEYMQTGFEEAIGSVIEGLGLGGKNMLISGCDVKYSNGKVSMTTGWCYYEGEILKVDAMAETSCNDSMPRVKLDKKRRSDSSGTRQIVCSGETLMSDVYEEWYLEPSLVDDSDLSGYRLAIGEGAWRLGERIMHMSKVQDSGLKKIVVDSYNSTAEYRMIGGVVQLYGNVKNDIIGAGVKGLIAKNMPRPAKSIKFADFAIDTMGQMTGTSDQDVINLDGLMYLATPEYANEDSHYSTIYEIGGGELES